MLAAIGGNVDSCSDASRWCGLWVVGGGWQSHGAINAIMGVGVYLDRCSGSWACDVWWLCDVVSAIGI